MRAWRGAICLVGLGLALLAMPQGAAAEPGFYVSKPSHLKTLGVAGSNGYRVEVFSLDSRHLYLLASRFRIRLDQRAIGTLSASYRFPARTTRSGGIRASLGSLGRISLDFQPSGPPKINDEGSGCKGRDPIEQDGRFVGILKFRGERGFTTVKAASIKGTVARSFRQVCRRPLSEGRGGRTRPSVVSLGAYAKGDATKPSFGVYESLSHGVREPQFSATLNERRGPIEIARTASTQVADRATFAFSAPGTDPVTASVAPPFPFSGSASFERTSDGAPTWAGDLAVELPGIGTAPLTGPTYTAKLCRSLACLCLPSPRCGVLVSVSGRRLQSRAAFGRYVRLNAALDR